MISSHTSFILRHYLKYSRSNITLRAISVSAQCVNSSNTTAERIIVPKRIPRGPTDILEALSTTVKRDSTAAHYKFHDDPFLIPFSTTAKRSYALAQEAGRKAASWVQEQHSDLFQHRVADPFIQAFAPPDKLTESTVVTEDLLKRYISTSQVSNAVKAYNMLGDISPETRQSLLELICFYNEEDQLSEDLIEERWFRAGMAKGKDRPKKTWKDNGLAEKVFNSIEPKTPAAYCALICGMASYGQMEGAWERYNQMLTLGFTPDLNTYNHIIRVAGVMKESAELKWNFIQEILKNMASAGIKPTVLTMNAILETCANMPIYRVARETTLQVLAEFKTIGVQPSLASYFFVLKTFCREKGPVSNILIDIVRRLEEEVPPLQDVQDVAFFSRAMEVCHVHLEDVGLARRLHKIFIDPQNQKFIGDSFKESIYYRHFMQLLCRTETAESLMETYRILVPNIYTPEPSVFEDILKTMKECTAVQFVPELWNDAVYMNLAERESVLEVLLQALASGKGEKQIKAEESDVDPILTTARSVWSHVAAVIEQNKEQERFNPLRWSGSMLGNLIKVFLQYDDIPAANQAMLKVHELKNELSSFVPADVLSLFIDKCVERNDTAMALMTVDYASEIGFAETKDFAKTISERLPMDERQQIKLKNILGNVHPPSKS